MATIDRDTPSSKKDVNQTIPNPAATTTTGAATSSAHKLDVSSDTDSQAGDVKTKARDLANEASQRASELTSRAKSAADEAGRRAQATTRAIGEKIETLATRVKDAAPSNERLSRTASRVADGLSQAGSYIKSNDVQAMSEDLANVVRRHPIPSILVGVGFGAILGRALKRSSHTNAHGYERY